MAWYIKRRTADGTILTIRCEERRQVVEQFYNQELCGGDIWIETAEGRRTDMRTSVNRSPRLNIKSS